VTKETLTASAAVMVFAAPSAVRVMMVVAAMRVSHRLSPYF